ncbi:MAG TPA: class I SAM-dependent RNA methyltransferase [Blastocatellia bacterium]|nr:class I SAM-dependent RNA methyltransferase [Blastocatellia bacterium]
MSTATQAEIFTQANKSNAQVAVGELHEVTIEKLVYGGDGLAHVGTQAVFVPFSAVGDQLRVRITEVERNYARGVIEEVIAPSPTRRTPPCPHFGVCGGCQLQHLDYPAQLESKVAFVRESLRRLGRIDWDGEIPIRAADEFAYRSRAEIKIARDREGRSHTGYFRAGTHEVCEVTECPILLPAANRELQRMHSEPCLIPGDATRVFLTVGDDEVIVTPGTGENCRAAELDALGTAHQRIGGTDYGFGVRSFFQANRLLVEELVNVAVGDTRGKTAVDLYAGAGLFTLQLAGRFEQVCAVEGNRLAASHGMENARANNIGNVRYEAISVEAWLKYKAAALPRPDLLLLDPPRAGAGAQVIERIAAIAPPQITYVSCDPATLARDLRLLLNQGYELASLTALDMFPQTFHVETVAKLTRDQG